MRISTKTPGYEASGRIIGARNWLNANAASGNPKVEPDNSPLIGEFQSVDRGVSITVRFDESTHPRKLSWVNARTAEQWKQILSVKTGLGAVFDDKNIEVSLRVIERSATTDLTWTGISYLWLHNNSSKKASYQELIAEQDRLYKKYGPGRPMPDKYKNLDFIYGKWDAKQLQTLIATSLDSEEIEVIQRHNPTMYFEFGYTAKLWQTFNERIGIRKGQRVLTSGFQLAANNMPQGETSIVPLNRNQGRQNQIHFLIHFENYTPDLGRKGFNRELVDFSKTATRAIMENHLSKLRSSLKSSTGVTPDLAREMRIDEWKNNMIAHEASSPLNLTSKHFFKPTERISITSLPTREQDVIALFNQLIAGGVIRGINIMSTNERFIYDGLFRIAFDNDKKIYQFDSNENPLGVSDEVAEALTGRVTTPKVLEYKFTLDGLFENFDDHDKNIKDVNLCVAWETGNNYVERYAITSFLIPENADQRPYHGVTHSLIDVENGSRYCDLIILSELLDYLNSPISCHEKQREKYD